MELRHPHDALSALLGASVRDRDGRTLGRVRDVLAERDGNDRWTVAALVVTGRFGRGSREIPWQEIADSDDHGLRLG